MRASTPSPPGEVAVPSASGPRLGTTPNSDASPVQGARQDRRPAAEPFRPIEPHPRLTPTNTAAAYGRKSRKDEDAVEAQLDQCARRAAEDGWILHNRPEFRYGDDAISGRVLKRPGIDALLAVVQSGRAPFRRLYIREIDRLARADDPRFASWFEYECKRHGVEVVYVKEHKHVDYADPAASHDVAASYITRAVTAVGARDELARITRRVREGTRRGILDGFPTGRYKPYATERWLVDRYTRAYVERYPDAGVIRRAGHRPQLQWVPALLPYVRFVFDALERGDSQAEVARALAAQGAPPPGVKGYWEAADVRRIARDPVYVGDYHYGFDTRPNDAPVEASRGQAAAQALVESTEPIYLRGFMADPPIRREQFAAVRRRLDDAKDVRRRRMASKPGYLLTGLLRCAACGRRLHGHTKPLSSGGARHYRHGPPQGAAQAACAHDNRYFPAAVLEAPVDALVGRLVQGDALQRAALAELARLLGAVVTTSHVEAIRAAEADLAKTQASAAQAADNAAAAPTEDARAILMQTVTRLAAQLSAGRERLVGLRAREAQLRGAEALLPEATRRARLLRQVLAGATPVDRRRVWEALVAGVVLDPATQALEVFVRVTPDPVGPVHAADPTPADAVAA